MEREQARKLLVQRRRQLIVHRYIYYVLNDNLISDAQYDKWERELRSICKQYPEICAYEDYSWCCPCAKEETIQ